MIMLQFAAEVAVLSYNLRQNNQLRRLRYIGGGGEFVELSRVTEKEFVHLPGLEPSACFHLFLSHAWPLGQDVCKLIKQRCREICPSLHVFLDVEDLVTGGGTKEVDHSRCIVVFAMPIYFEKINCVKELTRAVVRNKQITLLLPDAEMHGTFTQEMIADIVTDEWVREWRLDRKLAEWASGWGVADVKQPTAAEICDALFKSPPLEWSRITPFQDRAMVLMCRRVLPDAKRDVYLQGAAKFKLPNGHAPVKVYCSPHNLGAAALAQELNATFSATRTSGQFSNHGSIFRPSSGRRLTVRKLSGTSSASGRLLEIASNLSTCDRMLVYLNARTWAHEPESFAAEIREAHRLGVHLELCHEYPSVIDPGSQRDALKFKAIIDATPSDLKKGPTNIYTQIAISLKGGELREVGLTNVAIRLAAREKTTTIQNIALAAIRPGNLVHLCSRRPSGLLRLGRSASAVSQGAQAQPTVANNKPTTSCSATLASSV